MSFISINCEYYKTPEFIKFSKLVKSRVLEFMIAAAIRDSAEVRKPNSGAHWIWENHFMKGRLVGRYSQQNMAKYFRTRQSHISKYFSELEEENLIKKIYANTKDAKILYYQVGNWKGELDCCKGPNKYHEILFFDIIFGGYAEVAKAKRAEDNDGAKLPDFKKMMCNLDENDVWYEDDKQYYEGRIKEIESKGLYPING